MKFVSCALVALCLVALLCVCVVPTASAGNHCPQNAAFVVAPQPVFYAAPQPVVVAPPQAVYVPPQAVYAPQPSAVVLPQVAGDYYVAAPQAIALPVKQVQQHQKAPPRTPVRDFLRGGLENVQQQKANVQALKAAGY